MKFVKSGKSCIFEVQIYECLFTYNLCNYYYFDIDAWELFDLQNDPNELRNLYNEPKCQELIEMLKKELYALQKEYKDDMPLEERRELTRKYMIKYSE